MSKVPLPVCNAVFMSSLFTWAFFLPPGLHATPPGQFPERGPKPSKLSVLLYLMSIVFCCLGILALCRYPMVPVMTCLWDYSKIMVTFTISMVTVGLCLPACAAWQGQLTKHCVHWAVWWPDQAMGAVRSSPVTLTTCWNWFIEHTTNLMVDGTALQTKVISH